MFDADLTVQRVGIQEPEPTNGLDVGRLGHSLLFNQKKLILTNVLCTELIWRLTEVFGELGDAQNVGPDGGGCVRISVRRKRDPTTPLGRRSRSSVSIASQVTFANAKADTTAAKRLF